MNRHTRQQRTPLNDDIYLDAFIAELFTHFVILEGWAPSTCALTCIPCLPLGMDTEKKGENQKRRFQVFAAVLGRNITKIAF